MKFIVPSIFFYSLSFSSKAFTNYFSSSSFCFNFYFNSFLFPVGC